MSVTNHHIDILNQLPGYIGWKDRNFQYLGCNNNLASILKLNHSENIIGLFDTDLLGCTEEAFHFHKKNDQLALGGKTISCLHKSSAPYDGSFFYFVKKPMIENSKITGIIYHCYKFINSQFIFDLQRRDKKIFPQMLSFSYYQIGCGEDPFHLSERELECLFLLLRAMTAKQIGEQIRLSKRTVESYIENIKNKFGSRTKAELIVLAMNHGYLNIIPPRFLHADTV